MTTTTYEPGQPERDDLPDSMPQEAPDIEVPSTDAGPGEPDAMGVDPADPATEPTD